MLQKIETCVGTLLQQTSELAAKDGTASLPDVLTLEQDAWAVALAIGDYRRERPDNVSPPEETCEQAFQAFQRAGDTLAALQRRHETLAPACVRIRKNLADLMRPLARRRPPSARTPA